MGFQEEVFATSATLRLPTFCARRPGGPLSPVLLHLPTSGVRYALGRSGVLREGHWVATRHLGRKTSNASRSDALASAATPSSMRKTCSSARLRFEIAGIACPGLDQFHEQALRTSRDAGGSPDTRQRVATLVGWVRLSASACRRRGRNAKPVALDFSGADCNRREAFIAGGSTSPTASAIPHPPAAIASPSATAVKTSLVWCCASGNSPCMARETIAIRLEPPT